MEKVLRLLLRRLSEVKDALCQSQAEGPIENSEFLQRCLTDSQRIIQKELLPHFLNGGFTDSDHRALSRLMILVHALGLLD
jgi:hypothetical protein